MLSTDRRVEVCRWELHNCMQVLKLRAICSHCHREAAFTHRLGDEKDIEVLHCSTCAGLLHTTIMSAFISHPVLLWLPYM